MSQLLRMGVLEIDGGDTSFIPFFAISRCGVEFAPLLAKAHPRNLYIIEGACKLTRYSTRPRMGSFFGKRKLVRQYVYLPPFESRIVRKIDRPDRRKFRYPIQQVNKDLRRRSPRESIFFSRGCRRSSNPVLSTPQARSLSKFY